MRGLLESETELRELSAELGFQCSSFQHAGLLVPSPGVGFLSVQLPPWELSLSWAPAVLWLPPCRGQAKVVSSRLSARNSTINVEGCVISSVLSRCNKNWKQRMDQPYSPWTDQCYSSWINQCYSSVLQLSFI